MARLIPWYVWAAVGTAVVGAFWGFVASRERSAYIRGQDQLQQAIVKRDRNAAEKAQEARNALDQCYDTGGTWDQTTGKCIEAKK
jgi:hypothetical protein